MKRLRRAVTAATLACLISVCPARAAVLCQKRSGIVVVRTACKKKETPLDLTQFGAIQGVPAAGDLTGTYPAPSIAAGPAPTVVGDNPATGTDPCSGPTPQTGVYCGTSAVRWSSSAYIGSGIEFWRDRLGTIHLRGAAHLSPGVINASAPLLLALPAGARPQELHAFPIAIGQSAGAFATATAMLVVSQDGLVEVINPGAANQTDIFLGDIQFRPDS